MKISTFQFTDTSNWVFDDTNLNKDKAQLVLAFGARPLLEKGEHFHTLRKHFQNAEIVMASTSGEIVGTEIVDDTISGIAIKLEKTSIKVVCQVVDKTEKSKNVAENLAHQLSDDTLRHILVISDGQTVNGTLLVAGFNAVIDEGVGITGGLAGDASLFQKTLVGHNDIPVSGLVIAIGFYGDNIKIGYGSQGGWDTFGPKRIITKSNGNELFELDGKSALELYKIYLGKKADELPGSALLFPLSIETGGEEQPIVRTILGINEETQSMIFAGDMPEGATARMMKANFEKLIDGAGFAAQKGKASIKDFEPELALLISCVGRKLILGQRIEEELEEVHESIGGNPVVTGFYSYGEIAPFIKDVRCELHNQTMTITLFSEV